MDTTRTQYILTVRCPDARGIVARTATYLHDQGGSIDDAAQYGDPDTRRFFARIVFTAPEGSSLERLRDGFAKVAEPFGMTWSMTPTGERMKVLIAVSKFGHCLTDLLHRWRAGSLRADIVGVVSNHDTQRDLVEWHGIPYHHLPISPNTKVEQEEQLLGLVESSGAELVVLARYMQILSAQACTVLQHRCINIHHSFLPSFKGSRPYHAAHANGVKLIGATAHYVTPDLDEGPIIEQDVKRVSHVHTPRQMIEIGRDIEATVLARAVRWHLERRVFIDANKTVVFST